MFLLESAQCSKKIDDGPMNTNIFLNKLCAHPEQINVNNIMSH